MSTRPLSSYGSLPEVELFLSLVSSSHVSPEHYRHRFACLTFTVMDYDWLSTNDFAGEAVAPLSDFCWPGRPNASPAGKSVQPVILHLSRSKPSGTYSSRAFFLFYWLLGRPQGVDLGFQLPLHYSTKSHSILRYLCQLQELLPSVCSPLQRSQS